MVRESVTRILPSLFNLQAGLGCRIESRYENFSASVAEVSSAVSQLESVVKEAEALENAIHIHIRPGLQEASKDANETVRQMKELSLSVQSANKIKKAYSDMEKINELVDQRRYMEASSLLKKLEEFVGSESNINENTNEQDGDTKRAIKSVRSELISAAEKVHYYLGRDWDEHVQINTSDTNDRVIKITIDLFSFGNGGSRTTQIVEAMRDTDMLAYRLNKFGTKLMSLIIEPLMSQKQSIIDIEKSGEPLNTLQVTFGSSSKLNNTDNYKISDSSQIQEFKLTMDRLEEIFFFLNESTAGGECNIFLRFLGKTLSKEFSEL